jgi:DNA mismatch endonuclease, patch repair protein
MQAIRSSDTKPEMAVRRRVHALGLRYRTHARPLPDLNRRADLVFTRARVAVFVDGCFWHGCPDHGRRQFGVNGWYWPDKIDRNVRRDTETTALLTAAGWRVVRAWEHEDPDTVAARVAEAVRTARAD